jgi:hypothetical protein
VLSRELGHPGVDLDPEHPASGRLEGSSGDAGADADVEHVASGAFGDDPVRQGLRVVRPGPIVAFGVRAERLRHLPGVMRLACRERPRLWR